MRNLFKVAALPFAIFALSLGAIACGDDDNGDGGGAAGNGGSGGTGGTGGSGGTEDTRTLDQKVCDHWYSDQLAGTDGPCGGFVTRVNNVPTPVPYASCVNLISGQGWTIEEKECMITVACSQQGFESCIPPPPPPDPTPECDALCDHVYECGGYFTINTQSGSREATPVECKQNCPATEWASNEAITTCLATFECEGMTEEEVLAARDNCFPD